MTARNGADGWEPVIGLEVHAQLRTRSKLFSGAPNAFGGDPNTQTCEVDLGLPGVLPVLNERAVELAVRAALALGCQVHPTSVFARKHYFYPDLPKGYQISQYEEPFATGGAVPLVLDGDTRSVPLTRIHMEEDTGKMIHDEGVTGGGVSHVDLNRAGVPLVEIVSEPAIGSPEEAGAYLRSLRSILRALEVSDADMEKGHLRCDANVSVRPAGSGELGTKVELKNLNSFRFVERALAWEIERQIELLDEGRAVAQETRGWDERAARTKPQRTKEEASDYRYFPEPDLIPLRLDRDWIEGIRRSLPELPQERRARFTRELGLSEADAALLAEDRSIADFFEETLGRHDDAKTVAGWVIRHVREAVAAREGGLAALPVEPAALAALLDLVAGGSLTAANAREVFAEMARSGRPAAEIVKERGLEAVSDLSELEGLAREVLDSHPEQVAQYRAGEQKVFNFFVGQVMRRTRGKADPAAVRELLGRLLGA
jgi:aspartyl-tRNA(Asn)/glutamyl-tRNA(Gln) amidotransferase subunit B